MSTKDGFWVNRLGESCADYFDREWLAAFSRGSRRSWILLEPREYGEWLAESERPPVHLLGILGEEEMVVDPMKAEKKEKVVEPRERGLFDGM